MEIKNRFSGKIIFEGEKTLKELVIKNKARLWEADLRGADLQRADLWNADLRGSDLRECDLQGANLRESNLKGCDLQGARLWGADLWESNLKGSDLQGADLRESNLKGADLWGSNIEFSQFPSIRLISSVRLHNLTDNLQLELMRRDAFSHPHPKLFDEWSKTKKCPYRNEERFWLFEPNPKLWVSGLPQMIDRELIVEICKSQGWKIKDYL